MPIQAHMGVNRTCDIHEQFSAGVRSLHLRLKR